MEHALKVVLDEPASYSEAMASDDATKWGEAMASEMKSHEKNGTWVLVPKPDGAPVMRNKWVFKKKLNKDGSVARFKAREAEASHRNRVSTSTRRTHQSLQ